MLLGLAVIFAILWVVGFLVFHIASAFIHLILVIALALALWHFVSARRRA